MDIKNDPKKLYTGMIALAVLLVIAILAIIFTTTSMSRKVQQATLQNEQLQLENEQLQLSNEYQTLNSEFAQYEDRAVLLANDSLVAKYAAAKTKVEKLLQELKIGKTQKRGTNKTPARRNWHPERNIAPLRCPNRLTRTRKRIAAQRKRRNKATQPATVYTRCIRNP